MPTLEPYIIRGNLRAYRNTNNPVTVYVRDEAGPMSLTGVTTLQAAIPYAPFYDYGDYPNGTQQELLITAASPSAGKVTFTITQQQLQTKLFGPSFNLFVRADDQTIYTAMLEVVG